ncbi:MAG: heme ABC transporter ATP-binding protein [Nitriliruptoraceae bacterium]
MTALIANRVSYHVDARALVDEVSLNIRPGRLHAVVGPNGAGKTTLLRLLTGDLEPDSGEVRLGDRPLQQWRPREAARTRAVLSQQVVLQFAFTVTQVVEMGRAPYRDRDAPDEVARAVAEALEATDITHLADRSYPTLSGGERRRADLARVLAQRTPVVLLDEPTAALDVHHQDLVLTIARHLADDRGCAVVAVLHDLNLAAAYADRIAVLADGRLRVDAPPSEALEAGLLSEVYRHRMVVVEDPVHGGPLVLPARTRCSPPKTSSEQVTVAAERGRSRIEI